MLTARQTIVRKITLILCGFILVMSFGFFLLLWKPQMVLNTFVVSKVLQTVFEDQLQWEKLDIAVESRSFLVKTLRVSTVKLSYRTEGLDLVVGDGDASLTVKLNPFGKVLREIGPISVAGVKFHTAAVEDTTTTEQDYSVVFDILDALASTKFNPVIIDIQNFVISAKGESDKSGQVRLTLTGLNDGDPDEFVLQLNETKNLGVEDVHLSIGFRDYQTLLDPNAEITVSLRVKTPEQEISSRSVLYGISSDKRELYSRTQFKRDGTNTKITLVGEATRHRFSGTLDTDAIGVSAQISDVRLYPCKINTAWGDSLEDKMSLDLSCEGKARRGKVTADATLASFMPAQFDFLLQSSTELSGPKDSKIILTDSRLDLSELKNDPLHLTGYASISGKIPLHDVAAADVTANADFALDIRGFQRLVKRLHNTPWAVPAPINQLDGTAHCNLKGLYETKTSLGSMPLTCSMDFDSDEQTLDIEADGLVSVRQDNGFIYPHIKLAVLVNKLDFILPTIQLGEGMPRLVRDKRIVLPNEQAQTQSRVMLSYDISLRTKHDDSIKIHSNLTKKPVPLALDLAVNSNRPIEGTIAINRYNAEVLRRNIYVESLALQLVGNWDQQPIEGQLRMDNNDYKVFLDIAGTLEKPVYTFRSEPPLEEKDIIAMVVFGKVPGGLEFEEEQSVTETQAALADGAINLLSMYYLASTPIEHVGYDPTTGIFAARFAVRDGLSLTVGTDAGNKSEVGISRRLGNNWRFETSAIHDEETNSNRGVAMLKWGVRY